MHEGLGERAYKCMRCVAGKRELGVHVSLQLPGSGCSIHLGKGTSVSPRGRHVSPVHTKGQAGAEQAGEQGRGCLAEGCVWSDGGACLEPGLSEGIRVINHGDDG